ncbi:hypothetical protein ScPMuIL_005914 [Solemya velum]
MFTNLKVDAEKKNQFLEHAKAAREERAQEKHRDVAAVKIQALARGFMTRKKLRAEIRSEISQLLQIPENKDEEYKPQFKPALEVYRTIQKLFFLYHHEPVQEEFEYLCRYLLATMETDSLKVPTVLFDLFSSSFSGWVKKTRRGIIRLRGLLLSRRQPRATQEEDHMLCLRMLITFTHTATWMIIRGREVFIHVITFFVGEALTAGMNQLCNNIMGYLNQKGLYPVLQTLLTKGLARSKPVFTKASLSAITTLSLRPLIAANFSDSLLTVFILHILSVPAFIQHLSTTAPDCLTSLVTYRVFKRSLDVLSNEQSTRIIFHSLEGNYALCLLANLVHLGYTELEGLVENTLNFMSVTIRLLNSCKKYVQSKRSNLTHWHPVLGWFSQSTDMSLHEAMPYVVKQLQLLWCEKMIRLLFSELLTYVDSMGNNSKPQISPSRNILKKAMEKASSKHSSSTKIKLESSVAVLTCLPCALYQETLYTLSQLRLDILGGLSYNDVLLPILWRFLCDMGPNCGLKTFLEILSQAPNSTIHPVFSLLCLFCETASHLITTLDDMEFYEKQKIFKMDDYVKMSDFLNLFIFRVIWNGLMDIPTASNSEVFGACRGLLMILYEQSCRRSYTNKDHWLIRDLKASAFITELERGRKIAVFLLQKVPHIIPFSERVKLFRKNVEKEKDVLGLTESVCASPQSTLITVHRSRIVEDGYRQLAQLPARALKGIIRVKFINEQGLDEAGIDQDGVFKEFLEETIARVFDPSLNLFKVTSEQKLYPSSTSYIQDNHLALFEFVGKMLAKAVYEGIVVDVPFAPFFLTQILGHQQSTSYSSLDELPSLDPELAKSLSYIKHYEGDVSDLDLTFSCDEDCMGRLETHELVPGGKAIAVTNENKIRYVHLMAHFRMYRQIKDQTAAFIRGFKTFVNPDWLVMFSAPELQKLISGDNTDVDIEDLRKHTQYYGGYHTNHKVIGWLWDILEHDFNPVERSLFLKFVTSCSKPPLLGFAHLEPPFSIRCVEVSDDQDTGDTVGSILKGFFNIKKKDPVGRLPTSSTCFNLLKLPNYSKKSQLRDKMRYALHSNTGFELS